MKLEPQTKLYARTRRGWVVHQILRSIFTGEFQGGDRLVEEEVATTMGVSRTPVREAFSELAGIGLIDVKPNRGAIVRPFGPEQIRDIYHVRWVIESEATRLATPLLAMGALEAIRFKTQQYLDQPRSVAWSAAILELDQEFHELISSNCGNTRLHEEIERYRNLVQTIRQAVGNTAHAQDAALREHMQVIDAIITRDPIAAGAAMVNHIRRGTEAAVATLFGAQAVAPVKVTTFPVGDHDGQPQPAAN
jgi:DNA-binding GntR family transcriptional regulator